MQAHGERGTLVLGEGEAAELVDVPSWTDADRPDAGSAGHRTWAALSPIARP